MQKPPVPAFAVPAPKHDAALASNNGDCSDMGPATDVVPCSNLSGQHDGDDGDDGNAPPPALARFQPPDWAADLPPCSLSEVTNSDNVPDAVGADEEGSGGGGGAAGASNAAWKLEVLRGGVPVGEIDLMGRASYSFGRQGGRRGCDVVLEHPSISRAHAVLQHHRNGTLWAIDLGSTHGTSCNKRRLTNGTFEQVRPGDVVKFGDSSRLYIVHGPEFQRPPELESATLAKVN